MDSHLVNKILKILKRKLLEGRYNAEDLIAGASKITGLSKNEIANRVLNGISLKSSKLNESIKILSELMDNI